MRVCTAPVSPKRKIRAKPNEFIRMEKERTRIKKELKTTFVSFSASRKDGARREEAQGYEIAVFFIYDDDRIMDDATTKTVVRLESVVCAHVVVPGKKEREQREKRGDEKRRRDVMSLLETGPPMMSAYAYRRFVFTTRHSESHREI